MTFVSGHIHELRIHVPWHKLGSEPVVITINTIECALKLRDSPYDEKDSVSSKSSTSANKLKKEDSNKAKRYQLFFKLYHESYIFLFAQKVIYMVIFYNASACIVHLSEC